MQEKKANQTPEERAKWAKYYHDWRIKNLEALRAKDREDYRKNRDIVLLKAKEYRERPEVKERYKEYRQKTIDQQSLRNRAYREKNRDKINAKDRERRASSLKERLDSKMSLRIWKCLKMNKGSKRGKNWREVLGYTTEDLIKHLESQFDDKMSWDNYGSYWHIDHIIPKVLFTYQDLDDPQFKECWGLTNLRPLEGRLNSSKSDIVDGVRARDLKKHKDGGLDAGK
jgi:hypothetical protein